MLLVPNGDLLHEEHLVNARFQTAVSTEVDDPEADLPPPGAF
jgi:hypothetical protein